MTRNKFIIKLPEAFFWYMFTGMAVFVFLPIIFTIFQGVLHITLYVLCGTAALPFLYFMLKSKLFKISVNGHEIVVKKGVGRKYSFDIQEIVKVDWKIVVTKMGENQKIRVKTVSKSFSIESLMIGFEKMSEYIEVNVEQKKIRKQIKNLI